MDPCRFDKLVVIETRRAGQLQNVGSVTEATECLVGGEWPKERGLYYRKALRACYDCLAGDLEPEAARQAFIAAAREVSIFVREAPLRR